MSNPNDLFKTVGEALASSSPEVGKVIALADEAKLLEAHIEQLDGELKSANARYNEIKTKLIPDAMSAMGSSEWTAEDKSIKIKVEDFIAGSLPKSTDEDPEARQRALGLVEAYGGQDIIKTEVNLAFSKSEHNEAMNAVGVLRDMGLDPVVESGIHPQTYLAFIRERLKNGEEVDIAGLGLFQGRKAKITIKKEKKGQPNEG